MAAARIPAVFPNIIPTMAFLTAPAIGCGSLPEGRVEWMGGCRLSRTSDGPPLVVELSTTRRIGVDVYVRLRCYTARTRWPRISLTSRKQERQD